MISDSDAQAYTDPELAEILVELFRREPIFHRPEFGTSRSDFENMTAPDFWEVGASGRQYSRAAVLDALEKRFAAPHTDVWKTSDFECRRLAPNLYLLTYTLLQDSTRRTRRSTIWERCGEGWKIVYHQGTIVQDTECVQELAVLSASRG
jgi:hypothetical protein